jgi:hypothetical protein
MSRASPLDEIVKNLDHVTISGTWTESNLFVARPDAVDRFVRTVESWQQWNQMLNFFGPHSLARSDTLLDAIFQVLAVDKEDRRNRVCHHDGGPRMVEDYIAFVMRDLLRGSGGPIQTVRIARPWCGQYDPPFDVDVHIWKDRAALIEALTKAEEEFGFWVIPNIREVVSSKEGYVVWAQARGH